MVEVVPPSTACSLQLLPAATAACWKALIQRGGNYCEQVCFPSVVDLGTGYMDWKEKKREME